MNKYEIELLNIENDIKISKNELGIKERNLDLKKLAELKAYVNKYTFDVKFHKLCYKTLFIADIACIPIVILATILQVFSVYMPIICFVGSTWPTGLLMKHNCKNISDNVNTAQSKVDEIEAKKGEVERLRSYIHTREQEKDRLQQNLNVKSSVRNNDLTHFHKARLDLEKSKTGERSL